MFACENVCFLQSWTISKMQHVACSIVVMIAFEVYLQADLLYGMARNGIVVVGPPFRWHISWHSNSNTCRSVWLADCRIKGPTCTCLYWMKLVGGSVSVMTYIRSAVHRRRNVRGLDGRCEPGVGLPVPLPLYQGTRWSCKGHPHCTIDYQFVFDGVTIVLRSNDDSLLPNEPLASVRVRPSFQTSRNEDDNANALTAIRPYVGTMCDEPKV